MYREVKQIRHLFIAVVLTLALALFLPLQVHAAPIEVVNGNTITIDLDQLSNQAVSGTGWSYDGTTLTLDQGYIFSIDDAFECKVVNNGTINGGTVNGCSFEKEVVNNGVIDNVAFMDLITNNGTIGYSNYNLGGKLINNAEGVIKGISFLSCEVVNYGTLEGSVVNSVVDNYGIMDDDECLALSRITNHDAAVIKNSVLHGSVKNTGTLKENTANGIIDNEADGTIESGSYTAVTNKGTIEAGDFSGVDNYGVINDGMYQGEINNRSGASILAGTFCGTITNHAGGTIKGGTFHASYTGVSGVGAVENKGTIENGDFRCIVENYPGGVCCGGSYSGRVYNTGVLKDGVYTSYVANNSGSIQGGSYRGTVENYSAIKGGDFSGLIEDAGTIDCTGLVNAVAVSTNAGKKDYVVYGNAVLRTDIKLGKEDTMTIPAGTSLTIANGVTLDLVDGTVKQDGDVMVEPGGKVITAKSEQAGIDWTKLMERYNKDTVTEADRETLQNAVKEIDQLLEQAQLREETKAKLETVRDRANELLAFLDGAKKEEQAAKPAVISPKTGEEPLAAVWLAAGATMVAMAAVGKRRKQMQR